MRKLCLALLVVVMCGCSIKFTVINTVNDHNGTASAPHHMSWEELNQDNDTESK